MSPFLPVNRPTSPSKDVSMDGVSPPNTPRPSQPIASSISDPINSGKPMKEEDSQDASQQSNSSQKAPSTGPNGDETTVAESEGDKDNSDNEPDDDSGSAPPSKKKKGQRFFCTDFPPCSLSFTRSEHLARHIRKHTGERPFQCHCSRRFSRLDNLRQHAQTVHVNEEIPGDSLAATGTRFQRTLRTDRVRPPGRNRAGTTGSQGAHSRGHSRNLSTSSIASVASTASTFSQASDIRRRPPPLIMANDAAGRTTRLAVDSIGEPPTTPPAQLRTLPGQSPGGYAAFVAGGGSPHFGSPVSATSCASGYWESRDHARRLSVPAGGNPFVSQHGNTYPSPYLSSVTTNHTNFSNGGSLYGSPTNSSYASSRDEMSPPEAELRRRTWHPSTYSAYPRPATSGLSHYETPDSFRSIFPGNNAADQPTRLPGIESFDKVVLQNRPMTPPFRKASPMQMDSPHRPAPAPPLAQGYSPAFASQAPRVRPQPPISGPGHRRGNVSWDVSLNHNLTGLSLSGGLSTKDPSQWGRQTIGEIHNVALRPFIATTVPPRPPPNQPASAANPLEPKSGYDHPVGAEPTTPQNKHFWHTGSSTTVGAPQSRTSPEDSSSSEGVATPSTSAVETHPAIVHSNGYIERPYNHHFSADSTQSACATLPPHPNSYQPPPPPPPQRPRPAFLPVSSSSNGLGRLEALVAVATSESKDTPRFF